MFSDSPHLEAAHKVGCNLLRGLVSCHGEEFGTHHEGKCPKESLREINVTQNQSRFLFSSSPSINFGFLIHNVHALQQEFLMETH